MNEWPAWIDLGLKVMGAIGGMIGTICGLAILVARNTLVTKDHLQGHIDEHSKAHGELEKRLAEGEAKFAEIKADLGHLPDHSDIAEVKDRIAKVEGEVRGLSASIDGLKDVLQRIEMPLNILVSHHLKRD